MHTNLTFHPPVAINKFVIVPEVCLLGFRSGEQVGWSTSSSSKTADTLQPYRVGYCQAPDSSIWSSSGFKELILVPKRCDGTSGFLQGHLPDLPWPAAKLKDVANSRTFLFDFRICHAWPMCSVSTCCHLWRKQGVNCKSVNSGVCWQMPMILRCWAV